MCKQQQLRRAKAARCHHCMGLGDLSYKRCVSFRVAKPYPNAPEIAQYFCREHCTIDLLSEELSKQAEYRLWIEQAIAKLDEAGGIYYARQVYELASLQHNQLRRYPELHEQIKLRVHQAAYASKLRDYSQRIADALKELQGEPRLTVTKILRLARVETAYYNAHECLWRPVHAAIARSGGRVPGRGEAHAGGKRRAA